MPLPTPDENEKEQEFIARCVPLVIEAEELDADDEDQRKQAVAICYSQWRQATESKAAQGADGVDGQEVHADAGQAKDKEAVMTDETKAREDVTGEGAAVKFADEQAGIVEGLAIPYGGPMGGKDLQGEYFTPRTDLALKWFDRRPALFHHGVDPDAEIEPVGVQFETKTLDAGQWAKVQLDKAHRYYDMIADMVRQGKLFFSSGAMPHLVQKGKDGELLRWPWVELSLTPMPANPYAITMESSKRHYAVLGLKFFDPDEGEAGRGAADAGASGPSGEETNYQPAPPGAQSIKSQEVFDVDEKELQAKIEAGVAAALAVKAQAEKEAAEAEAAKQKEIETKAWEMARVLVSGRKIEFPVTEPAIPGMVKDVLLDDERTEPIDLALTAMICGKVHTDEDDATNTVTVKKYVPYDPSNRLLRAIAMKAYNAQAKGQLAAKALADLAVKSDEVMHSDLTSYGAEWVPTLWSAEMWRKIRLGARILPLFTAWEMPSNPAYYPIQSTGFTIYKVPETADEAQLVFGSNNPFTDSQVVTGKLTFTAGKAGALGFFSEELVEDAIVPIATELRTQLVDDVTHGIDEILINGDETGGVAETGNISYYGSAIGTVSRFLVIDGLRHLCLVTNTANKRDGGVLAFEDFHATRQLMGTLGKYGADPSKCVVIPDLSTWYKISLLDEYITQDKAGDDAVNKTGVLWTVDGMPIVMTEDYPQTDSSGYINATAGNNTVGSFLVVRRDGVKIGWRRHVKVVVGDIQYSDAHYILATVRFDLQTFDSEMAALSYNITI